MSNATNTETYIDSFTVTMKEFLESSAPGIRAAISDVEKRDYNNIVNYRTPEIRLHCEADECGGVRTFACTDEKKVYSVKGKDTFLNYICQNCKLNQKTFAVWFTANEGSNYAVKYGEIPAFGPPTPARALSLIGADRELFLKGRRCELQGLGIGAFTYYRRVIEDQRNRIFDEIIRVLEKTDPASEVIADIKLAKSEQQFSKSIEAIKHAIPSSLLVNGQNPLRLLYSALSEGVHAMSDEECLGLAAAARTVLFEFSDRLAQALRDDAQLIKAVALLNKPKVQAKVGQ